MYSLLIGFWRVWVAKVQYQILILGLDDSGKTTFLEQLRHVYTQSPSPSSLTIPPTVGLNIAKLSLSSANLLLWDLGGQEGLRVIWDKYYSDSHALIYMIDSTSTEERFNESMNELVKVMHDSEIIDAPVLILLNKTDSGNCRITADDVRKEVASWRLDGRILKVHEISALSGRGVEKGLEWLMSVIPMSKRTRILAERAI